MAAPRKRLLTAALALLALAALAGCGGGGDDSSASAEEAGVSSAQVAAAPPGTPQRTVLEWWRDVQRNDPEAARALYVVAPDLPDLAGQFNFVSGELDGTVAVLAVKREGSRAVLRVRWVQPGGSIQRETLRLRRDGPTWKLLDARFLDELVARMQRAEAG